MIDFKNDDMLFSAGWNFARRCDSKITQDAMDKVVDYVASNYGYEALENWDDECVIDTRIHMLKPGWYPAIPGWHCDAIPRPNGQPDLYDESIDRIHHFLYIVDQGTGSTTEFLNEQPKFDSFPEVPEGTNLWEVHSTEIERRIKDGLLVPYKTKSEELLHFTARDYHTAIPATGSGWRYFFRCSFNTKHSGPYNEIRRQVQVYTPTEHSGW